MLNATNVSMVGVCTNVCVKLYPSDDDPKS